MLDDQLKSLKQLPTEHLKKQLKPNMKEPVKRQRHWQLPFVAIAFCLIAFCFILTTPALLTTSTTSERIYYHYFDADYDAFKAKPSLLYTGMQKGEDASITDYLSAISSLPKVADGNLGQHIVDVLYIEDGVQHRYKLSNADIYSVDEGVYYRARDNDAQYLPIFDTLYHSKTSNYTILFPLIILLVNGLSFGYYKRLGVKENESLVKTRQFYIGMVTIILLLVTCFLSAIFYGPVLIIWPTLCIIMYFCWLWMYFTRYMIDLRILRLERIKLIVLGLTLIGLFTTL